MKFCLSLLLLVLAGCDTMQGINMPVVPAYKGEWQCAINSLSKLGYESKLSEGNQLSVFSGGDYLFSVYADDHGTMRLYLYSMNTPLSCKSADRAYSEMKSFLSLLSRECGYQQESVSVSLECSPNK